MSEVNLGIIDSPLGFSLPDLVQHKTFRPVLNMHAQIRL